MDISVIWFQNYVIITTQNKHMKDILLKIINAENTLQEFHQYKKDTVKKNFKKVRKIDKEQ